MHFGLSSFCIVFFCDVFGFVDLRKALAPRRVGAFPMLDFKSFL